MVILIPSLVKLRSEFNELNALRDKSSDGWIGDRAHATSSSDHNPDESGATPYEDADSTDEVHAIDIDKTGPWRHPQTGASLSFGGIIERIREQHENGQDNRLQNIIWNGRIASRSWGWDWRTYNGSNKHTEHAHFSGRYTTAQENDTSSYNLYERVVIPPPPKEEEEMFSPEDLAAIRTQAKLGFYDALKEASAAADSDDATVSTPTGRQLRDFFNFIIDNANVEPAETPPPAE
jgi:hypothetical protein